MFQSNTLLQIHNIIHKPQQRDNKQTSSTSYKQQPQQHIIPELIINLHHLNILFSLKHCVIHPILDPKCIISNVNSLIHHCIELTNSLIDGSSHPDLKLTVSRINPLKTLRIILSGKLSGGLRVTELELV